MRWSEAETIKFVELYRQYEILWNVTSFNYRNKSMKLVAYQALSADMGVEGFGVAEVKQKIKNLRCTYNQEVTKIEKSKLSGDSGDVYFPSVKWFHLMDDLVKNLKEQKLNLNNSTSLDLSTSCIQTQKNDKSDDAYHEDAIEDISYSVYPAADLSHPSSNPEIATAPENKDGTNFRSMIRKKRIEKTTTAVQELRKIHQILQRSKNEGNECDAFGRYIALQLKKLPLRDSLMAQTDIQNTLVRYIIAASVATNSYPNTTQASTIVKEETTSNEYF